MSRRIDLLQRLIHSKKFGDEKDQEQKFLAATAELILTDLINIAITGVEKHGAGSLVLNLSNEEANQEAVFISGNDIEHDITLAESNEDEDTLKFLRQLIAKVDGNDWSKYVLITLISENGTRTFAVEAGGSQESLRSLAAEFSG
tara:strand:- start:335 stop:769 length:435 start_codon:yes stop_codon:yes gene_type:complete